MSRLDSRLAQNLAGQAKCNWDTGTAVNVTGAIADSGNNSGCKLTGPRFKLKIPHIKPPSLSLLSGPRPGYT